MNPSAMETSAPAANANVAQRPTSPPVHHAAALREPSPMARFPTNTIGRTEESRPLAPSASTLIPSLSYGGPSRSSSVMQSFVAPPPPTTRPSDPPPPPSQSSFTAGYAPTAAAYDNTIPGQLGGRSGSMVPVAAPVNQQRQAAGSSMRAPSVDALLRRGTFDNFRTNPVFVSTNIRPYASSPQRGGAAVAMAPAEGMGAPMHAASKHSLVDSPQDSYGGTQQRRAAQPHNRQGVSQRTQSHFQQVEPPSRRYDSPSHQPSHVQPQAPESSVPPPTMNAVAAATFSKPNPFRSQTFEDYCEAPHYDRNVSNDIVVPQHQRQMERNQKGLLAISPQGNGAPPLYDPQQSIAVLSQGDWFLKWTRIESAHRRYVWLDLNRGVISWAKSRDSSFFLQKSVKLEDIMDLQPLCTVDEASGRSFYQVMVVSTERQLKIGTELRDKFDVWFDTLQRLCEAQRVYTNTYIGRHAASNRTKPPHDFARRPAGDADATE